MTMMSVDFDELLKINPDTRGWIYIHNTNVNYPFVQSQDNSYYLNHSFDKSYNNAGWVFLDYRNDLSDFNNKNTILYAHNMNNKTMFGTLINILSNDFYKKGVWLK